MNEAKRAVLERRARFVAAALAGAGAVTACNDRPPMASPYTLAPIDPVPTVPASEDPTTPPPSATATPTASATPTPTAPPNAIKPAPSASPRVCLCVCPPGDPLCPCL